MQGTCEWIVEHRLEHWRYELVGRPRRERCGRDATEGAFCKRHQRPGPPRADLALFFPYTFHWNRAGRKGQHCRVRIRGARNSRLVEFEDGFEMITSGNALRRRAPVIP
jgi:hypothetical protein